MSSEETRKTPQSLGFDEAFDEVDPAEWTPPENSVSNDRDDIAPEDVKEVGEQSGFTSRQAAVTKERTEQINFRAKESTIADFRRLCGEQSPEWRFGYGFERAIAALKRELEDDQ